MKKLVSLLVLSMFVLVVLSGCGKGAEGKLVGKTFSFQVDGEIPGTFTFKDNGLLMMKDSSGSSAITVNYEFQEVDGKEYVVFWNRPQGERFLRPSQSIKESKDVIKKYWYFDSDSLTLKSLKKTNPSFFEKGGYMKDKKYLKDLKFGEDKEYIKLIEEK